jgi:hypothetical protein
MKTEDAASEIRILEDGDVGMSENANGTDLIVEALRHARHAVAGLHAETVASEIGVFIKASPAAAIAIPVIAVLGEHLRGGNECNRNQHIRT